jgi:hypothetical protein
VGSTVDCNRPSTLRASFRSHDSQYHYYAFSIASTWDEVSIKEVTLCSSTVVFTFVHHIQPPMAAAEQLATEQ